MDKHDPKYFECPDLIQPITYLILNLILKTQNGY